MSSITFGTHQFARKLQEAGFDEKRAEGLTKAMRADIDDLELLTHLVLHEFKLKPDPRFEAIKSDMSRLTWMMGALIPMAGANFSKQFFKRLNPQVGPITPPGAL